MILLGALAPWRLGALAVQTQTSNKRSRPISRVLSRTVIHLGCPSPDTSSDLPGNSAGHANVPLFGLAPGGVCPATPVTRCAVRSYRTISPLPAPKHVGGMFSVALSVGSRLPGVTWHPALWSPDFPPWLAPQRLSGRLRARLSANCQKDDRLIWVPGARKKRSGSDGRVRDGVHQDRPG